jgi:hypothetical protein
MSLSCFASIGKLLGHLNPLHYHYDGDQLLTVALTTVPTMIVILIGILINNARLTDVKEALRAEMEKNHSEMLHRVGDLDSRLTRIENGLGMNRG